MIDNRIALLVSRVVKQVTKTDELTRIIAKENLVMEICVNSLICLKIDIYWDWTRIISWFMLQIFDHNIFTQPVEF